MLPLEHFTCMHFNLKYPEKHSILYTHTYSRSKNEKNPLNPQPCTTTERKQSETRNQRQISIFQIQTKYPQKSPWLSTFKNT